MSTKKTITKGKNIKQKTTEKVVDIKNKAKKKVKNSNKHRILTFVMIILITIMLLFVAFAVFIMISAPTFSREALYNKESTIIYDKNEKQIAKIGTENRELVTYDELPQVLVDAIIATEDSRYYQHNGFDIARFLKASVGQLLGNSSAGGASTLTMQVVKNTFTSTEASGIKGIIRKFTDIYMAVFKVEKNYTKEEIIEFYVNAPYLGNGSYGVEAASQTYFGKSVSDLTLTEASLLAGLFQAPSAYDPYSNPELANKRRNVVLSLMVKHGYITEKEKILAQNVSMESLLNNTPTTNTNKYQAFIDTVVEEVEDRTGFDPYSVPMIIYSTMDPKQQDYINTIMNDEAYQFINDKVQNGIAITSVKDGSITAVGAGRNRVGERQYNYATMINRHPGSAAKPFFDYGPLIEYNGASPATYFFDWQYGYTNGGSIKNADNSYSGLMNMKTALARSRNIPALQAFQQVEKESISEYVHNFGINYGDTLTESASIGGFEGVNPVTMSAAYGAYAREGIYIEPYSFSKIIYRETGKEYKIENEEKQACSDSTAFMINYILKYAAGNNIVGKLSVGNTDIAAKTGTSTIDSNAIKKYGLPGNAVMDSWANIYTPDYAVSIWYGYDDISKGNYITLNGGGTVRTALSKMIASNLLNTGSKWSQPSSVIRSSYEKESIPLMKPSDNTPSNMVLTEYFKKGTEPTIVSGRFQSLENPTGLSSTLSNNTIKINWKAVTVENSASSSTTKEFFEKSYGKFSTTFYNKYLGMTGSSGSTFGYYVYLKNGDNLSSLGFTTDTSYSYKVTGVASSYTFVVKSGYQDSNKQSSGVSTSVNGPSDNTIKISFINQSSTTPLTISAGSTCPQASATYNNETCTKVSVSSIDGDSSLLTCSTLSPGTHSIKYQATCSTTTGDKEYDLLIQ